MNTRTSVAAAVAAAALLCAVPPVSGEYVPSRPQDPKHQYLDHDSDPWVPDGRDPGRALPQTYGEQSTDTRTPAVQPIRREDWYRYVLRVLRTLALGGILR
jgi:hypothetical protein